MTDITITYLPDGGAVVEFEGETTVYTAEELAEMERDYRTALERLEESK